MESIWFYLIRAVAVLGLFYMALASVVLAVLLKKSWDRRGLVRTVVTECPYCDGRGTIGGMNDEDVCPLCDGECAIVEHLPAQVGG